MSKKSLSIGEKLDRTLNTLDVSTIFDDIDYLFVNDDSKFNGQEELQSYLNEGALLNISVIGSKALSVPCGEYMVWATDSGNTVLMPVGHNTSDKEVFEANATSYEIFTGDLLKNWSRVDKILSEELNDEDAFYKSIDKSSSDRRGNLQNHEENLENNEENLKGNQIASRVDPADIDRHPILRAMEDRGHTVTSLAKACGVDPPAISRILRTPKERQGDPGGRNPSMGLAAKICSELRIDPTSAFPDIFTASHDYESREGNSSSGMGSHAQNTRRKGDSPYNKGNQ